PALVILGHAAILPKEPHHLADGCTITAPQLEQQALEIARHLDVHAGREARLDGRDRHPSGRKIARENVVTVGANDQPVDRESHAASDVPSIYIAEIAGRHT